jgi:hypothetical protein
MRQITLNIPDSKFDFFMKIVEQMGLDIERGEFDIPKWQQEITMKRAEEYDADPSKAVDFDMILRDVEQKYER